VASATPFLSAVSIHTRQVPVHPNAPHLHPRFIHAVSMNIRNSTR